MYPIKVQAKKNVIYNLRLVVWYSQKATYNPLSSREEFLNAINTNRNQYYYKARAENSRWLNNIKDNYFEFMVEMVEKDKYINIYKIKASPLFS